MNGILWLASYPKSGNTWARAFIANLIHGRDQPLSLDDINNFTAGASNIKWFEHLIDKPIDEVSTWTQAKLRVKAQKYAVSLNKNVIPMKTHSMLGTDQGHEMICMDVTYGAIYIVRDPRDVTVSGADHYGKTIDEMIGIMNTPGLRVFSTDKTQFNEIQSTWSIHVKSWTQRSNPRLYVVRYEDLLADPFKEFSAMARKFGIVKDEAKIRQAVERSSFKQLQKMEKEHDFAERSPFSKAFFRQGKSGGWKDVLTPEQAARIEKDHGEQMRRFGYL